MHTNAKQAIEKLKNVNYIGASTKTKLLAILF